MSRFSNKCDLYDWLASIAKEQWDETPFDVFKRLHTVLFRNDTKERIDIDKPSDLVPYYPYYDAVHLYVRDEKDTHYLVPPNNGEYIGAFFKVALESELRRVEIEEDPKYV